MIVTCPACSTRYLVDPRALGASGRLVRCANCAHTWHQAPPEDAPRRVDLPPPAPEAMLQAGERVQLPALSPPRRSWSALGWLLYAVVLVAILAGGLWWARDRVVAYWPDAARYYGALGIPVATGQPGLEIHKLVTSRETENGLPTLIIQAEVVNVSDIARSVPKLKVTLEDSNKHELQSWAFTVTDERLLPGASVPFRTSIAQPSDAATGVVLTFVNGS